MMIFFQILIPKRLVTVACQTRTLAVFMLCTNAACVCTHYAIRCQLWSRPLKVYILCYSEATSRGTLWGLCHVKELALGIEASTIPFAIQMVEFCKAASLWKWIITAVFWATKGSNSIEEYAVERVQLSWQFRDGLCASRYQVQLLYGIFSRKSWKCD